jgi:aminoglycoside phosphotransferase family enzyme
MVASSIDISSTTPDLTELVDRATTSQEIITLTTKEEKSAVLISLEAFEYLVGMQRYRQKELMPADDFQQQFRQALTQAGYNSREKIIDLVKSVKQEMYDERSQQH